MSGGPLKALVATRAGLLVVIVMPPPVSEGAATGLLPAVAREWRAGPDLAAAPAISLMTEKVKHSRSGPRNPPQHSPTPIFSTASSRRARLAHHEPGRCPDAVGVAGGGVELGVGHATSSAFTTRS